MISLFSGYHECWGGHRRPWSCSQPISWDTDSSPRWAAHPSAGCAPKAPAPGPQGPAGEAQESHLLPHPQKPTQEALHWYCGVEVSFTINNTSSRSWMFSRSVRFAVRSRKLSNVSHWMGDQKFILSSSVLRKARAFAVVTHQPALGPRSRLWPVLFMCNP
jgi:hypothetical protein